MVDLTGECERLSVALAAEARPGGAGEAWPGRAAGGAARTLIWNGAGDALLWASPAGGAGPEGRSAPRPSDETRDRLRRLASGLAPRAGFRLERLHLDGDDPAPGLWACRAVTVGGDPALATVAMTGPASAQAGAGETVAGEPPVASEAEPDPAGRLARARGRGPVRFTWASDPSGRITSVSPDLADVVGRDAAAIVGSSWSAVARSRLRDGGDLLEAAAAPRSAWSAVRVLWDAPGTGFAVPVELGAMPVFGRAREFAGHRGFGLLRPDAAVAVPASDEPPRPDPATPSWPEPAEAGPPPPDAALVVGPATDDQDAACGSLPDKAPAAPEPAGGSFAVPAPANTDGAGPQDPPGLPGLSSHERAALDEIARTLAGPSEPPATTATTPAPADPPERAGADGGPHPEGAAEPTASEPALAALERSVAELHAVLEIAADGVLLLDEVGRILAANAAAGRLFGIDREQVTGEIVTAVLLADDHVAALGALKAARLGPDRQVVEREVRTVRPGRVPQPLLMRLARIVGADGRPVYPATFHDGALRALQDKALREQKLAAADASAGQIRFLARVSHEIRTPLNAIIGFTELMLEERFGPVGSERYAGYLRDIKLSGEHVLSLVNDLLDLAKVSSGRGELAFGSLDLNSLARQGVDIAGPLAARERAILRTSLAPSLPAVVADERSIRQVVLNLLSNAIRFTGPGGHVIVSTAANDEGQVTLRVRDTGPGMRPDEIEDALTPFRQVGPTRRADGTGLGLPLSKALVEANGGSFAIGGTKGAGTLVEVRLPTSPRRDAAGPVSRSA